jgi:L-asparaginase / beta-aspartyl-peptidase
MISSPRSQNHKEISMRSTLLALALVLSAAPAIAQDKVILVIHGGAGGLDKKSMTPKIEKQYRDGLAEALKAGHKALVEEKGSSLDGVEAAIKSMEASGTFNAGRGAVFNRDGRQELNASIMDGKTKKAGGIAGISRIKHPIAAARVIMEKSEHVLMIGEGAERYCHDQGVEMCSPLYLWNENSWKELQQADTTAKLKAGAKAAAESGHFGTVGAVALDTQGNLAAGTSTGGITFVRAGRVGDSPIIGAGTFAENETCAVSCTGKGELFIRYTAASDIAARMKYRGDSLKKAATEVLTGLPKIPGGAGGLIALDRQGNVALPYNTNCMFRGTITQSGKIWTAIHEE